MEHNLAPLRNDPRSFNTKTQKNRRKLVNKIIIYTVIFIGLTLFLFPVYWMVAASLQPNSELIKSPPSIVPSRLTFSSYLNIFTNPRFRPYFKNSGIVSFSTVTLNLFFSILAGYSFSRFRFWGRTGVMTAILSVQMFPRVAILIVLFGLFTTLKLTNSYIGLVLGHLTFTMPFSIWFLKSFFDGIPYELEEAALIDGANRFQILFKIVVPLATPGIISVLIYTFLLSWNDFMYAFTLVTKDELRTLPVGIALTFIGEYQFDWSGMMALATLTTLPVIILFIFLQRYMIAGLTQGALKG